MSENENIIYNDKKFPVRFGKLNLSNQEISDLSHIEGLDQLKSIEVLELNGNNISEIKHLDNLTNLKVLDLSNNKISSIQGLNNLKKLRELNLNSNEIEIISGLDDLGGLQRLFLENNRISEIKGIIALKSLRKLRLGNNMIERIQEVHFLLNLRELCLNDNSITHIANLDALANLEILKLERNQISKITGLKNLEKLKSLRIKDNPIPESNLDQLGGLNPLGYAIDPQKFVQYCKKEISLETKPKPRPNLREDQNLLENKKRTQRKGEFPLLEYRSSQTSKNTENHQAESEREIIRVKKELFLKTIENLQSDLTKAQAKVKEISQDSKQSKLSKVYLKNEVTIFKNALKELRKKFDKVKKKNRELDKENTILKEKSAELIEDNDLHLETIIDLKLEMRKLTERISSDEEVFDDLAEQILELKKDLKILKKERDRYQEKLKRLQDQELTPNLESSLSKPHQMSLENFTVYISQMDKGFKGVHLEYLAQALEKTPDIDSVHYWEENSIKSLYYLDELIDQCNVFLIICAEPLIDSGFIEKEWQRIHQLNKKKSVKIIILYSNPAFIPDKFNSFPHIQFNGTHLDDFVAKIYETIMKHTKGLKLPNNLM